MRDKTGEMEAILAQVQALQRENEELKTSNQQTQSQLENVS